MTYAGPLSLWERVRVRAGWLADSIPAASAQGPTTSHVATAISAVAILLCMAGSGLCRLCGLFRLR